LKLVSLDDEMDEQTDFLSLHDNKWNQIDKNYLADPSLSSASSAASSSSLDNELKKLDYNSSQDKKTSTGITGPSLSMYSFPMKVFLSMLAISTSLITIVGNILVMTAFFLDRQIRNPTNYFILSLSISDFLIGLFSMPLYTLYLMLEVWPFGTIICNLWLSLDYTVCLTSIYTVLFITIDR
jgi:hypothetical protein